MLTNLKQKDADLSEVKLTENARPRFDAIALELAWTRLISTADEAGETLKRTAFSTLVNESNDYAIVITDAKGDLIVQNTDSIPAFIGTLPMTIKHLISEFDGNIHEDDVLITNDPWLASGHLNDITIVKPLFRNGKIIAFAGSCAHAPDIGGRARSPDAREVYEEGFMIPPLKLFDAGKRNEVFFKLFLAASRMPYETEGDIFAAMTALNTVDRRVHEFLDDYALDDLHDISKEINDRSEKAMRTAIKALPDGNYTYSFDTDGFEDPLHFEICVSVRGDHILVDFAGTSSTRTHAVNCPSTYVFAMVAYALKCLLLPKLPNCEGPLRCFDINAPKGSILNPQFPAAVGCRTAVGQYVPPLIFGALAKVVPDKIMATPGSPLWSCVITGRNEAGHAFASTLFFNGGMGATERYDGEPCYSWPSNVSNVPIEMTEVSSPLFVHYKRLVPDSGGLGKRRGGLGIETLFEITSDTPVSLNFIAERTAFPAEGLNGGGNGAKGILLIDGKPINNRKDQHLKRGQTVLLRTPGGAGLGPASEREAELIKRDQELGYVTN